MLVNSQKLRPTSTTKASSTAPPIPAIFFGKKFLVSHPRSRPCLDVLQGINLAHRVFNGRQVGRRQFTQVLADAHLVYGAQLVTQGDR